MGGMRKEIFPKLLHNHQYLTMAEQVSCVHGFQSVPSQSKPPIVLSFKIKAFIKIHKEFQDSESITFRKVIFYSALSHYLLSLCF